MVMVWKENTSSAKNTMMVWMQKISKNNDDDLKGQTESAKKHPHANKIMLHGKHHLQKKDDDLKRNNILCNKHGDGLGFQNIPNISCWLEDLCSPGSHCCRHSWLVDFYFGLATVLRCGWLKTGMCSYMYNNSIHTYTYTYLSVHIHCTLTHTVHTIIHNYLSIAVPYHPACIIIHMYQHAPLLNQPYPTSSTARCLLREALVNQAVQAVRQVIWSASAADFAVFGSLLSVLFGAEDDRRIDDVGAINIPL